MSTKTLTAAATDADTVAHIQRAVAEAGLAASTTQNVSIGMANGRVLLQGSVPSETERQRIHSIATAMMGATRVDNQITIATP